MDLVYDEERPISVLKNKHFKYFEVIQDDTRHPNKQQKIKEKPIKRPDQLSDQAKRSEGGESKDSQPSIDIIVFFRRLHRSEQYTTSSQHFFQAFRHSKGR